MWRWTGLVRCDLPEKTIAEGEKISLWFFNHYDGNMRRLTLPLRAVAFFSSFITRLRCPLMFSNLTSSSLLGSFFSFAVRVRVACMLFIGALSAYTDSQTFSAATLPSRMSA